MTKIHTPVVCHIRYTRELEQQCFSQKYNKRRINVFCASTTLNIRKPLQSTISNIEDVKTDSLFTMQTQKGAFRGKEDSIILQKSKHISNAVAEQFFELVAWLRCHFSHMRIWTESTGTFVTWTGALNEASHTIVSQHTCSCFCKSLRILRKPFTDLRVWLQG